MTVDKWGNDWMDDAVPGAQEIADVMLEIRKEHGWTKMWSDSQGLDICPRVTVWLDGYSDHDYMEGFLLKVWTNHGDGDDQVTVTDHLFIFTGLYGGPDKATEMAVEWRQEPRLFFDADNHWLTEGLIWWAKRMEFWMESQQEVGHNPSVSLSAHNAIVTQRDRDRAVKLGLAKALPYLAKLERYQGTVQDEEEFALAKDALLVAIEENQQKYNY